MTLTDYLAQTENPDCYVEVTYTDSQFIKDDYENISLACKSGNIVGYFVTNKHGKVEFLQKENIKKIKIVNKI